jgi:1-acyl-sn-glycerol-3-phosphate acyltransferase
MSDRRPLSKDFRWKVIFLRSILTFLFALLTRRQVYGLENIPAAGPCLIVFNHVSNFDPPLLFTLVRRTDATGLVADAYQRHPFYRLVVEMAGGTWIRRGASDREALRAVLALLDQGWIVGVAPEGRRSSTGALSEGKRGPAFLAIRANVPIVPIGLSNTEKLGGALKDLRRITLTVRIGKPFLLPPDGGENHKQYLQTCTDMLMCRIAALLPPEYRGVYAEHPQLQALLAGAEEPPSMLPAHSFPAL